jgi:hypothetical protein
LAGTRRPSFGASNSGRKANDRAMLTKQKIAPIFRFCASVVRSPKIEKIISARFAGKLAPAFRQPVLCIACAMPLMLAARRVRVKTRKAPVAQHGYQHCDQPEACHQRKGDEMGTNLSWIE